MLKPTIGPIIGHVTTNHARIFIRGDRQDNATVFAGIRYRIADTQQWSNGIFAKLSDLRDMSEVFALNNLSSDTEYEFQAGWFSPMNPVHTQDSVAELPLQWPRENLPSAHSLDSNARKGLHCRLLFATCA